MDVTVILRNYKIPILLGGVSVFTIVISIVLLVKSTQTAATPIQFLPADEAGSSGSAQLTIDIEGAVIHPGVYSLPGGTRVEDAITAAGGLGSDADSDAFAKTMNRAMKLVDGGKIYVPFLSSSPVSPLRQLADPISPLVSVNSATEGQLDGLPGVGPVTAQKIIANRPYQTLEELVGKKAVGSAVFEKIKAQLSL